MTQEIIIETNHALPTVNPHTFHGARTVEIASMLCHEANRAWCASIGDDSQKPFAEASEHARESVKLGVLTVLHNPSTTPEASHHSWLVTKINDGWVHGDTKDEAAKTHPCILDYDKLPREQRVKDHIFVACAKQALRSWGPRLAFLEQTKIASTDASWRCTDPVFTYGLHVIIGRIASTVRSTLIGLAHGLGYPAPLESWERYSIPYEIQNMINASMQTPSATAAYDLLRRNEFPAVMPALDAVGGVDTELRMLTRGMWFIAYGLVRAGLEIEGVTVVPKPGTSRWTYALATTGDALAIKEP